MDPKDILEWLNTFPDFKEQVKFLREKAALTQGKLAELVELTPRSIRNIEKGEACPKISTLERIAAALNADLKILLLPHKEGEPGSYRGTGISWGDDMTGSAQDDEPGAADGTHRPVCEDIRIGETD